MIPDSQAIVRRLEELEKQVAHLTALLAEHSDTNRTVVARNFVVKDAAGVDGIMSDYPDRLVATVKKEIETAS